MSEMIDIIKLTSELMEADCDLQASPTIPADEIFSDLREMIVHKGCNQGKALTSTDDIELKLDEADRAAAVSDVRYTHEEVFSRIKG